MTELNIKIRELYRSLNSTIAPKTQAIDNEILLMSKKTNIEKILFSNPFL